jgi:hypothetical protein
MGTVDAAMTMSLSIRSASQPHDVADMQLPGTSSVNPPIAEFTGSGSIVTMSGLLLHPSTGRIGLFDDHVLSEGVPATPIEAIDSDGGGCSFGGGDALEHATNKGTIQFREYDAIFMKHVMAAREL